MRTASLARVLLAAAILGSGCTPLNTSVSELQWADDIQGIHDYRFHDSTIDTPISAEFPADTASPGIEPRHLLNRADDQQRELSLQQTLQIALLQSQVVETSALGKVGAKTVLTSPGQVASVYDPAIQSSGVLFGQRGVEAALSEFDAQFETSLLWGRSDLVSAGSVTGDPNTDETARFRSGISKRFANGGQIGVFQNWDYLGTDRPGTQLPSTYLGQLGINYRMPLLQGSGVDYTRIAGPFDPRFGAITGVSQGVVIARINHDISLADFEIAVRNALRDLEHAYWDLYLSYRVYDTAVTAHRSAFQTWREARDRLELGAAKAADELQALDRLYETRTTVEVSLNKLYLAEAELRRLMGLPANDGTVLVPTDDPPLAELVPDWQACVALASSRRVELRRQRWQVKSLQLQLSAARSLVRPRLDLTAEYGVNAYGDRLLGDTSATADSGRQIPNGYDSLINDDFATWAMGFEFEIPIGLRFARTQVQNLELQLARANAVLVSQEKNVRHDVASAIQNLTASYSAAHSSLQRLHAARQRTDLLSAERELGRSTLDLVVRAQASAAAAQNAYYEQLITYSKAVTDLQLSTGSLLTDSGVFLAEGDWKPEATADAMLRAAERTHGHANPHLQTRPPEFVQPGRVEITSLPPAPAVPAAPAIKKGYSTIPDTAN